MNVDTKIWILTNKILITYPDENYIPSLSSLFPYSCLHLFNIKIEKYK